MRYDVGFMRDPFGFMEEFTPFRAMRPMENDIRVDVEEFDDHSEVTAVLPGFAKEEVKVSLSNGVLTIAGEHEEKKEEKDADGKMVMSEIYHGSVSRRFTVDKTLTEDDIKASFENGVLKLNIAKKLPAEPEVKQIEIK